MKIYTKRGDAGKTDLFGGGRVLKNHPRVVAYGKLDAANCAIGSVLSLDSIDTALKELLIKIMSDLLDLGAELATESTKSAKTKLESRLENEVNLARIETLETEIDRVQKKLAPLKSFILPTGCECASRLHLARTSVRIAEQSVVALLEEGIHVREEVLMYLNRLSDLCFVWARYAVFLSGASEINWEPMKGR